MLASGIGNVLMIGDLLFVTLALLGNDRKHAFIKIIDADIQAIQRRFKFVWRFVFLVFYQFLQFAVSLIETVSNRLKGARTVDLLFRPRFGGVWG
jgi:hypothetical protein